MLLAIRYDCKPCDLAFVVPVRTLQSCEEAYVIPEYCCKKCSLYLQKTFIRKDDYDG